MAFRDDPNPFKKYIDPAAPPPEEIPPLSEVEVVWIAATAILIVAGVVCLFALAGCRMIAL